MSNVTTRIRGLSADKRARLARLLQKKLKKSQNKQPLDGEYDVVILGGGLAGATLAIQLKQARPETSILVAEKRQHPVPEAAFKVGESTVELGSYYLREVLGLAEHIETCQLPKAGLRYFFRAGDNSDITQRLEFGVISWPMVPSYQLDRGRFENMLREENLKLGVTYWDACKVQQVSLDSPKHVVTLERQTKVDQTNEQVTVSARWVIDASGRAGILKRQLGLTEKVAHDASAVWFRIDDKIDVTQWSEDENWRGRVPDGLRWLSTNHLMGRGYWVWLIPLPSGATSVGIVADTTLHPHKQMNRFERALAWLYQHEPQCAKAIDEKREHLQDFHALKHYAHGCQSVFSTQRWSLTGEAGVFVDPFYSPGTDFIGINNTFITQLILKDFAGFFARLEEYVEPYNRIFLSTFKSYLAIYEGQYPLMGNVQVMLAKIVWDFAIYWGVTGLLFFHHKSYDLYFLDSVGAALTRFNNLNTRMQLFFREWDQLPPESQEGHGLLIDYMTIGFLEDLHCGLKAGLNDNALQAKFIKNINLLESIAREIFAEAQKRHHMQAWQNDPFFSSETRPKRDVSADLNKIWL